MGARNLAVRLRGVGEGGHGLGNSWQPGDLEIRYGSREVAVRGEPVALAPKEFELLRLLSANAGRLVHRETIEPQPWGEGEVKRHLLRIAASTGTWRASGSRSSRARIVAAHIAQAHDSGRRQVSSSAIASRATPSTSTRAESE